MSFPNGKKRVHKFSCTQCNFVYDPRLGNGDIVPNTPFEALPNSWECPKCSAKLTDFKKKYEVVEIDL